MDADFKFYYLQIKNPHTFSIFSSGDEISGYFYHRGQFLTQFFQWIGGSSDMGMSCTRYKDLWVCFCNMNVHENLSTSQD